MAKGMIRVKRSDKYNKKEEANNILVLLTEKIIDEANSSAD